MLSMICTDSVAELIELLSAMSVGSLELSVFLSVHLKKIHDTNSLRIIFLSFSRHYKAIIFQPSEIRNLAFVISHT